MPQPQAQKGLGSSTPNTNSGSIGQNQAIPTGTGIQIPVLQHQFIVRVEGTPTTFTEQSTAFAINMVKNELLLLVEQSVTSATREHIVIQDWINNPARLVTLDILDAGQQVVDTVTFSDAIVEDHNVDFNCAYKNLVVHILKLSYNQIGFSSATNAASAFASAMSIVGKP